MITTTVKGLAKLEKVLRAESQAQKKALSTATKVEGFRLMKLLKSQIRKGSVAGQQSKPLSFIRRYETRSNRRLRRLAIAVRYFIPSKDPIEFRLGWTGPKVSKSWKRIAEEQQKGFTRPITEEQRRWIRRRLTEKGMSKRFAKYFRLRKTTTVFKTPATPILDPFWRMHEQAAWRNIRSNFRRKMRGKRI